ncbi:glycosyltransferase family 25 protein [Pseudomonas entomophila]|uniref:Glycosyltransferase family 25 protein n=1 Tax=Pseudomonas entomophila TaxID=312306 RepID=A0ABY9QT49_9PSED|nr:glycosyltransferase family 25 protein [Pseudomonas entomophila]WMW05792.1 glycosyltransferase family 25 protein [Pseudomonas entomophila]
MIRFDVDAVYCISLDARSDRRELFRESIAAVLDNPVIFHIVEKQSDPKRGCYESHQALAQLALDQGLERILIFEDDVKPYPLKASRIRWINRFMRTHRFEALHLGYSMGRTWLTWFPFIARGKVVALHAYVLSREGCKILAQTPYDGTPVDVMFKRRIRQHCVFPMMFRQHAAAVTGSDLELVVRNEDEWWERNWRKHWRSPLKNLWRTVLRLNF